MSRKDTLPWLFCVSYSELSEYQEIIIRILSTVTSFTQLLEIFTFLFVYCPVVRRLTAHYIKKCDDNSWPETHDA